MKTHKCAGGCGAKLRKRKLYCKNCARRHNPRHKTYVILSKYGAR